jgi:hypothetical protein
MRPSIFSLAVACILVSGSSPAWAQSPTASPGPTVEPPSSVWTFPEHGITIAFPGGWDVSDMDGLGPPWAILTASSGMGAYCEVIDQSFAAANDAARPVGSLDDWLAATFSRWDHDLTARNVTGAVIDLPAGRVGRVTMDLVGHEMTWGDPDPDWASLEATGRFVMYLFGDGDRWFLLDCSGGAGADAWLSIARTFEFLPEQG